ncbi:MAG: hypothetical protein WC179_03570 [Candidatus Cloacimonadaceae bacterium]|nr:hypothetical protein [Candidatus Cloacimonadota bacterium]MDD5624738.1 hypothetical protein [Candidatus Cloacimonadota bacterium]MDY0111676.1 hypothetical protein [Candidatus Syntrophosphaera sp.]
MDGVITGFKIATGAIESQHLQDSLLSLTKLHYELQNQDKGVGDNSQCSLA